MSPKDPSARRLFVPVTREMLPRITDKYPFLYLERGRLEVEDSSVKWTSADGTELSLPVATIQALFLGPGISITHEAVHVLAQTNCLACWVGEDALVFYAGGVTPVGHTRHLRRQMELAMNPITRLAVARALYQRRFPHTDMRDKTIEELLGLEGKRQRDMYKAKAQQYGVDWQKRLCAPGKFESHDLSNQILSVCNHYLYGIITACVHSLGYSPHIGFIHSGGPLPLVYDFADLYKDELSIDLAFALPRRLEGRFQRPLVADAFRQRVLELDLLKQIVDDLHRILGADNAGNNRQ